MENKNKTNVLLSIAILLLVALCIIGIGIYKVWKDSVVQTAVINTNTANMNTMTTGTMVTVSNGNPQSETKTRTNDSPIEVSATNEMTDTQIVVKKNDKIQITATGRVNAATDNKDGAFSWVDPDGWKNEPSFNAGRKGLSSAPFMSLVARVSKSSPPLDDNGWTFIGSGKTIIADSDGTLYLAVNEKVRDEKGAYQTDWFRNNQGSFTVTVSTKSASITKAIPPAPKSSLLTLQGTDNWKDSGVAVKQGQTINISASGSVVWDQSYPAVSPNGTFSASQVKQPSDFPMPQAGCGSLIMRVGKSKYAVGASSTITAQDSGRVEFIVNDRYNYLYNNSGSFTVNVQVD